MTSDTRTSMSWAAPLGLLWKGVMAARNRLYDAGRLPVRRLPVPVISIGNLTVGGTGKTPFTAEVARLLGREGWLPCILSRGHGGRQSTEPLIVSDHAHVRHGATEAGDEPFLLARLLPGVPVVVGADRHAAGMHALARLPVHLFLLDDGFQHRQLHRDADVVLLDATDPWGGGRVLPAGRLRESRAGLARAQAVVLTRVHQADSSTLTELRDELARRWPSTPVFFTRSLPTGVRDLATGEIRDRAVLKGLRVLAFAAIGRPASFFSDLEDSGAIVAARQPFCDHHPFTDGDLRRLIRIADEVGALALVTTEKDAVRLPGVLPSGPPILALRTRVIPEDEAGLLRVLSRHLPGPSRGGRPLT